MILWKWKFHPYKESFINYRNLVDPKKILNVYDKLEIKYFDVKLLNEMTLNEKVVILLIYINNIYKNFKQLSSTPINEINEICLVLNNALSLISLNESYFLVLEKDIYEIISSKKNSQFYINFYTKDSTQLSSLWYLILIVYSLTNKNLLNGDGGQNGFINRLELEYNSSNLTWVLTFLNLASLPKESLIKLTMILSDKHLEEKKIFIVKDSRMVTNFFLKFVNIKPLQFMDSLQLEFGLAPYSIVGSGFASSTFLSYKLYTKKSKKQLDYNYISPLALINLSKRPLYLDLQNDWELIESLFVKLSLGGDWGKLKLLDKSIEDLNFIIPKETDHNKRLDLKRSRSRAYYYLVSKRFLSLGVNKFYLNYFYDWRGRFYSYSLIDPLNNKHLRPFYTLNSSLNKDSILLSQFFKKINYIFCDRFSKDPITNYFITVLYLELGKLYVKTRISHNRYKLHILEIVQLGIDTLGKELLDLESELYRIKISRALNSLINGGGITNVTVFKDATASSFQHWGTLLKLKSGVAQKLNFDGDYWSDVYSLIINIFLKKNPLWSNSKFLLRGVLKKFIMTVGYNSGVDNCRDNLIIECKKLNLGVSESTLISFSKTFHEFIKNDLFEEFFLNSRDSVRKINFLNLDDAQINLNYFFIRNKPFKKDFKIADKRWVLSKNVVSLNLDNRSTYTALNANVVQALDAEFARYIAVSLQNVIIIHDSFGVSIYDLHKLMDESNLFFQKKLKNDYYSTFILI